MKSLFLSLLFLLSANCFVQGSNFVVLMILMDPKGYPGYAITRQGDTVHGKLSNPNRKGTYLRRGKGIGQDSLLKTEDLRSVLLKRDSSDAKYIQMDYLPQYKNWYRKIYTGKRIYYGWIGFMTDNPDALQGNPVICTPRGECVQIDGSKEARKQLIDYINRTYKATYRYRDLPTSLDAIHALESRL